jgi:hypothetical protein
MKLEKGIAVVEASIILGVCVPLALILVLLFEMIRVNHDVRYRTANLTSSVSWHNSLAVNKESLSLLKSLTQQLQTVLNVYKGDILVVELDFYVKDGGVVQVGFRSFQCSVQSPNICSSTNVIAQDLKKTVVKYAETHAASFTRREPSPYTGKYIPTLAVNRIIGVAIKLEVKEEYWKVLGNPLLVDYVDIMPIRQEVFEL